MRLLQLRRAQRINFSAGLYSFGPTGSPTRGLGTICSNSKRTVIFGMSFVANETISVLNITVGYEQFRYHQNQYKIKSGLRWHRRNTNRSCYAHSFLYQISFLENVTPECVRRISILKSYAHDFLSLLHGRVPP
jgi:hypothetical protein